MSQDAPLRIDAKDLFSPQVEEYLDVQTALQRGVEDVAPQSLFVRVVYSSWFYLAICSGVGGFCGWAILEPFIDDNDIRRGVDPAGLIALLMVFPTVAAFVGLFLGAAEGIMCRNPRRAV